MGRKLREDRDKVYMGDIDESDVWRKNIQEMQKQVHYLQMRVVGLTERTNELEKKIRFYGGDPAQLEMDF